MRLPSVVQLAALRAPLLTTVRVFCTGDSRDSYTNDIQKATVSTGNEKLERVTTVSFLLRLKFCYAVRRLGDCRGSERESTDAATDTKQTYTVLEPAAGKANAL